MVLQLYWDWISKFRYFSRLSSLLALQVKGIAGLKSIYSEKSS